MEDDDDHANAPTIKGVGYLLVGGVLIFLCSSPFITAVVEASAILKGEAASISNFLVLSIHCFFFFKKKKVSPTLLAFFLAPIASEMPEILEAVSLSRKGHVQAINVAYSNLIGGTITKTTLMCGIFSVFGVWKVRKKNDFFFLSPFFSHLLFKKRNSLGKFQTIRFLSAFLLVVHCQRHWSDLCQNRSNLGMDWDCGDYFWRLH